MNDPLSRREREIMDILYRLGPSSVSDAREAMADPPSYSAVRALLATLEEKGHIMHARDGRSYIYRPRVPREQASRSALSRVVRSFFGGSSKAAAMALLQLDDLDESELSELEQAIARAREQGK